MYQYSTVQYSPTHVQFVYYVFFSSHLQVDRFTIEAVDIGSIYKLRIRHDNSFLNPAWYLDRVEVTDPYISGKYLFHCERWLGKNKEDGKIERSLYVKVN